MLHVQRKLLAWSYGANDSSPWTPAADEHLPAGSENPWTTWKALDRLRTQVGRSILKVKDRVCFVCTRFQHLDLNECDVGVRIGDVLYNSMAYADDITVFSTNAKDLQRLIDMCTMYSDRWRFKYGIDKSKCMIIGKSPFTCEPVWRLNDVSLRNVDTIEILGNVFNSKGNNTSHVDNRLNKCRQSFYSLNSLGMSYPGGTSSLIQIYMSASFNLRHGMYE